MSDDDNPKVTISYGGKEVTTDAKAIANLADRLQGEYRLETIPLKGDDNMAEFVATLEGAQIKPVRADGRVVGRQLKITLTAGTEADLVRMLGEQTGNAVRVTVESLQPSLFNPGTGEIRDKERV